MAFLNFLVVDFKGNKNMLKKFLPKNEIFSISFIRKLMLIFVNKLIGIFLLNIFIFLTQSALKKISWILLSPHSVSKNKNEATQLNNIY